MSCETCGSEVTLEDLPLSISVSGDDTQLVVDGVGFEISICDDDIGLVEVDGGIIVFEEDAEIEVISIDDTIELIECCEQGLPGSGGGGSGLVYSVQNGPDYQASYTYVGYKEPAGAWYIYRRTYAGNVREYADGASGYSTAWTNRTAQVYS